MVNFARPINLLLTKALFWSARLLTVAAILLLGKANEASAENREPANDNAYAANELSTGGQMSYVMVDDMGEDWKDDPIPVIE